MNLFKRPGGRAHGTCLKGERRKHTLGARLAHTLGGVGIVDNLKREWCLLGQEGSVSFISTQPVLE